MIEFPEEVRDLLENPVICILVTMLPDGQPQATPVWFEYDGQHFLINTAIGRQKALNMNRQPKVTLLLLDPEDRDHYVEIRGHIAEITQEGAENHIDKLSNKFLGMDFPARNMYADNEVRAIYKVAVDKFTTHKLDRRLTR